MTHPPPVLRYKACDDAPGRHFSQFANGIRALTLSRPKVIVAWMKFSNPSKRVTKHSRKDYIDVSKATKEQRALFFGQMAVESLSQAARRRAQAWRPRSIIVPKPVLA